MVVPQLVKGGFFVGGEGGNGTLMARHGNRWSDPAFYTLGSASFGLQIGLEVAEVVLFVMSDRALNAWMRDEVRLGGQAGLTVLSSGPTPRPPRPRTATLTSSPGQKPKAPTLRDHLGGLLDQAAQ